MAFTARGLTRITSKKRAFVVSMWMLAGACFVGYRATNFVAAGQAQSSSVRTTNSQRRAAATGVEELPESGVLGKKTLGSDSGDSRGIRQKPGFGQSLGGIFVGSFAAMSLVASATTTMSMLQNATQQPAASAGSAKTAVINQSSADDGVVQSMGAGLVAATIAQPTMKPIIAPSTVAPAIAPHVRNRTASPLPTKSSPTSRSLSLASKTNVKPQFSPRQNALRVAAAPAAAPQTSQPQSVVSLAPSMQAVPLAVASHAIAPAVAPPSDTVVSPRPSAIVSSEASPIQMEKEAAPVLEKVAAKTETVASRLLKGTIDAISPFVKPSAVKGPTPLLAKAMTDASNMMGTVKVTQDSTLKAVEHASSALGESSNTAQKMQQAHRSGSSEYLTSMKGFTSPKGSTSVVSPAHVAVVAPVVAASAVQTVVAPAPAVVVSPVVAASVVQTVVESAPAAVVPPVVAASIAPDLSTQTVAVSKNEVVPQTPVLFKAVAALSSQFHLGEATQTAAVSKNEVVPQTPVLFKAATALSSQFHLGEATQTVAVSKNEVVPQTPVLFKAAMALSSQFHLGEAHVAPKTVVRPMRIAEPVVAPMHTTAASVEEVGNSPPLANALAATASGTVSTVPCSSRMPVYGDRVLSDGGNKNDGDWVLRRGEVATVAHIDKDGDFKLRNPEGKLSRTVLRKFYTYEAA